MHALSAIGALWRREVIKFVRDRARLIGALLQPLGFWILLGLGFQGTFVLPAAAGSDMGFFEFLFPGIIALIILFTAIFSTISIVEERKSGFLQGVIVAPVPRISIVLGTTLGGTSLAFFEAALFLSSSHCSASESHFRDSESFYWLPSSSGSPSRLSASLSRGSCPRPEPSTP
jgi:ABC-2 type transport system permease protein